MVREVLFPWPANRFGVRVGAWIIVRVAVRIGCGSGLELKSHCCIWLKELRVRSMHGIKVTKVFLMHCNVSQGRGWDRARGRVRIRIRVRIMFRATQLR